MDLRLLWSDLRKKKLSPKTNNPKGGTSGCCLVSATGISAGRRAAAATLSAWGFGSQPALVGTRLLRHTLLSMPAVKRVRVVLVRAACHPRPVLPLVKLTTLGSQT